MNEAEGNIKKKPSIYLFKDRSMREKQRPKIKGNRNGFAPCQVRTLRKEAGCS